MYLCYNFVNVNYKTSSRSQQGFRGKMKTTRVERTIRWYVCLMVIILCNRYIMLVLFFGEFIGERQFCQPTTIVGFCF